MKFHEKIRSFRLWLSRLAARLFPRGIYYVSGPETLPPPLSREEEREALAKQREAETKEAAFPPLRGTSRCADCL